MVLLDTFCEELERLDKVATGSDTIESFRACLQWPLTTPLSPTLISHSTWKRHIRLLLNTLVPRWAFVLLNDDHQALRSTLLGPSPCALMARTSLPLLLESIHAHATSLDILDLYTALLKHYVSRTMVASYLHTQKEDPSTFGSLLCSIPSRLANAYGLQGDGATWYSDRSFYSMLTRHIASVLSATEQPHRLDMAGELVGKMIRQGYQDICVETLLPVAIKAPADLLHTWDTLWTLCEQQAPMEKLYGAILRYTSKHMEPMRHVSNKTTVRTAVQSFATLLAPVLFATRARVDAFLQYTLNDTSRLRLVDDLVLRVVVAVAVHATGLDASDAGEWKLSLEASDMIARTLRQVVDSWTDPVLIKQMSDGERLYVTTSLLILLGYSDKAMVEEIQRSTGIVQGISAWFTAGDEVTAKLAMIVAESMSYRTKDQGENILDFGIPMDQRFLDLKELALVADGLIKVDVDASLIFGEDPSVDDLSTAVADGEDEDEDDILLSDQGGLDPDELMNPDEEEDEEEEDSDLEPYPMEDESDDNEEYGEGEGADPKKKKARVPVYISELVGYLKDQEDPEKLEIGLNAAEGVIRRKCGAGSEVEEWAFDLGKRLIYFPESYEIDNFRRLQQLALVALMVACPTKITCFIIEQLFSQNTSIGQKNVILAAISMVALELSGWDSYSNKGKDDNKGIDMNTDPLALTLPSIEKAGKLVFSSSRAQADLKRQKGIVRNRLSGLAGPIFFFPLVTGWWEISQLRLRWMTQDPMLVERFIMTLNVIMQCASNTPDNKKIVKEYFDYAFSLRYVPKLSSRILRALLLGINTIIHICYKEQGYLLLTNFTMELSGCQQWLEDVLEKYQQDTELQQLTLKLLVSIGQLAKMESYQQP